MRTYEIVDGRVAVCAALLTLAVGCYTGAQLPGADGLDTDGPTGPGTEDTEGTDLDPDTGGGDPDAPSSACDPDTINVSATAPMRRLTRLEYNNTVRDVLDDHTSPAELLAADRKLPHEEFDANRLNDLSADGVEQVLEAAEAVALRAVSEHDLPQWLGCDPSSWACVEAFAADRGRLLFRRPLTPDELAGLEGLYQAALEEDDPEGGIEDVLAAMLASPHFLYLVELGEPTEPGSPVMRLSSYEVASRLSYFLWSSAPDADLLDRAEQGALDDPDGIAAEARRMLADDRARDTVQAFTTQWLHIDTHLSRVDDAGRDPALYPQWSVDLRTSMLEELSLFVDDVLRVRGEGVDELLTAPYGFVDANLAEVYGVDPPLLPMTRVELNPETRPGLLTRAAVLTSSAASPNEPNLIYRGLMVRNNLMCAGLGLPEEDVDQEKSSAERVADAYCGTCHAHIDPLGQTFDAYDAVGALRSVDVDNEPVDDQGTLFQPDPIDGPQELIDALLESGKVHECLARRWTEFGLRTENVVGNEKCAVERVSDAYANSGYDIREALIELTTTDAFRFRRVAEAQ